MSTDAEVHPIARPAPEDGTESHFAEYRADVTALRRGYRRRAVGYGFAANSVSLLLVAAGAAVGLSPLVGGPGDLTALLGVAVILLEGVTRVLRPALRACHARRVTHRLDREFRLYDAQARAYRTPGPDCDVAFVNAIESILEQADQTDERDQSGPDASPRTSRRAA